ncbi:Rha family transcriptional regulator [Pseudomonas qingdaonensis]|uniref:Rha family transcriptional regulator n=1 Tax=Pseudomonas qingdaonensis TaxID=2056231 RepID=UPI00265F771F|nr:Rha family transcriptional regulator [Pseudomonas qingdaonensis]WKL69398.1 Rha family transcriptional regulator [Pseudomonas qingdaonensis]
MHPQTPSVQALIRPAPQNANHDFVARTMSSREIAELTGKRHDNVKRDIVYMLEKLDEDPLSFEGIYLDGYKRQQVEYLLDRELTDTLLTGYSPKMRRAVIHRWRELEAQVAPPAPADLSKLEILQMALESEKARVLLTVQVEAQAKKIDHLENLFKEGMSPVQFCKGLNGVNVMQVNAFLKAKNWLYTEGSSGTRYRVGNYARDKYMTEHQQEITPHGKEAFISYTPILLRKGAVRLYELYLAGELPMKKNWDGLHTHDKAVRGAA